MLPLTKEKIMMLPRYQGRYGYVNEMDLYDHVFVINNDKEVIARHFTEEEALEKVMRENNVDKSQVEFKYKFPMLKPF